MGPPRERGGEMAGWVVGYHGRGCFNGAAARTRRRGSDLGKTGRRDPRASMGPPRERGGEFASVQRCAVGDALQWGRRANAAERTQGPAWRALGTRLQWGRRANAAERLTTGKLSKETRALQWGRRANAAESRVEGSGTIDAVYASMGPPRERGGESSTPVVFPRRSLRFNGAAARTRRRVRSRESVAPILSVASMGPPRERGGEPSGSWATQSGATRFNGAAARTRRRVISARWSVRHDERLQWGRRANAAERMARPPLTGRRRAASMGPPRERGGEFVRSPAAALILLLQWGRRANAAERSRSPASPGQCRARFNGAAARTRRRVDSDDPGPVEPPALQWGRRANAAERTRAA